MNGGVYESVRGREGRLKLQSKTAEGKGFGERDDWTR